MSPNDRAFILERTRWPTTIVLDGGRLHGFLMPRWRPSSTAGTGSPRARNRRVRLELPVETPAVRVQPASCSRRPAADPAQTLALVRDLATMMATLHRYGLVIGDVSARNILWTDRPSPRVALIDCDGIRPAGGRGVVTPKQSPEWDDPTLTNHETTQASDVYKLALAAYRAVWMASSDRPPADLGATPRRTASRRSSRS